jgi:hypothetical protein
MATIAVNSKSYIRPRRGDCRTRAYKEEASQTFVLGEILIQDGTTKDEVEIAGADQVANIVGVAARAATGTANTMIDVWLAEPGTEFIGHIQDAGTLAAADLGTNYAVVKDSTNVIWRVDTSDTANACVTITDFIDAVGDVNARVAFQFLLP